MKALALAIERRQWEAMALFLLWGALVVASQLSPDALTGLFEVLEGENGKAEG